MLQQESVSCSVRTSSVCGWKVGKRDTNPCNRLERIVYGRSWNGSFRVENFDLPKPIKWLNRLNDCGKPINGNKFCETPEKTYVWECVGLKIDSNFGDWAYMESPFQYRVGVGADGIGFYEHDAEGKVKRCTRYTSFTPWRNADLTNLDDERENQWNRSEKTLGPRTGIRPNIIDQNSSIIFRDDNDAGILCFWDKLYIAFLSGYIANTGGQTKFDFIDNKYHAYFVPREISRTDRMDYLISRLSGCNVRPCIKQSLLEWPCVSGECQFGDVKEGDETSNEEMVWYKDQKGNEIKIKKKDLLNPPAPCFNVCMDKVIGGECEKEKEEILALQRTIKDKDLQLKILQQQFDAVTAANKELTNFIKELKQELNDCEKEGKDLKQKIADYQAEIAELKKNRRDVLSYSVSSMMYCQLWNVLDNVKNLGVEGFDELYSRFAYTFSSIRKKYTDESMAVFEQMQNVVVALENSLKASASQKTQRMGYYFLCLFQSILQVCAFATLDPKTIDDDNRNKVVALFDEDKIKDVYKMYFNTSFFEYSYEQFLTKTTITQLPYWNEFYSQESSEQKENDSGCGTEPQTQEESQESEVHGLDGDGFRRPFSDTSTNTSTTFTPQAAFESNAMDDDSPAFSANKENEPPHMEDESRDPSPSQG